MSLDQKTVENEIKTKLVELAENIGMDASGLEREEIIPATGLIDSAALLELLAWFEDRYEIDMPQDEVTIDNLGSLALMAEYALRKRGET